MAKSSSGLQQVGQDQVENSFSIVHSFNKILWSADYVLKIILYDGDTGGITNNSQRCKKIGFIQAVAIRAPQI